jgi:molybdenum cofactor cytidylyltransferase
MPISNHPSNQAQLRLAVILLAAGEGSRLGSVPKALLKKDGQTLLGRFCDAIASIRPVEFLVVTGFHMQAITDEMKKIGDEKDIAFQLIHNPQAQLGQSSSVRLGIESLKSDYDAVLIALSDQPEIQHQDLMALIKQFAPREVSKEIVMPLVDGQRGNPVIFSKKVIDQILAIPNLPCRQYMDQHPEQIQVMPSNRQAFIQDVDTLEDLNRLGLERT